MGRPFIVMGDTTDHGGTVVGASGVTDINGRRIARVGDQVTCPKRGHGTTVIVSGDPTMIIDGQPAARQGDKCACGATLIASQFVATTSDGGASNPQGASNAQKEKAAAGFISRLLPHEVDLFDDWFALTDEENNVPLGNTEYAIRRASGSIEHGTTDRDGRTHLLSSTAQVESIDIYL